MWTSEDLGRLFGLYFTFSTGGVIMDLSSISTENPTLCVTRTGLLVTVRRSPHTSCVQGLLKVGLERVVWEQWDFEGRNLASSAVTGGQLHPERDIVKVL